MAGLLDFLSPVNADGSVDAHKLGLLNMLQAGAQYSQPTRTPTSALGATLGTLAAGGQGGIQAAELGPKLGLLNQQARGAQIGNDLNQINLDYYKGAQLPTGNSVAGLLSQGGGGAGAAPSSVGNYNVGGGAAGGLLGGGGAAPGGSGFVLDPSGILSRAQTAMRVPALKDTAMGWLKLYEKAVPENSGVMTNGVIAPYTGAPDAKFTMEHAGKLGETLAENNKTQIVPPSASMFSGPRTVGEYQASLQPGERAAPNYVNPNSAANNITLNTGKTLAEVAAEGAGKALGTSLETTQKAVDGLPALDRAEQLLPQIAGLIGTGGSIKTALLRAFDPNNPQLAARAEYTRTVLSQVGALARDVGGTQISDTDTKLATKLAGGDLDVTEGELRGLIQATRRAALQKQATHNARVEQYVSNLPKDVQSMIRGTNMVNLPPGTQAGTPAAATPAAAPAYRDDQTATNPTTGEKIIMKNGQWVPVR